MNFVEFMEDINEYDLLGKYKNMTTKVLIRHNECGREYEVSPSSFKTKGQRCIKCTQKKLKENIKIEYIELIEKDNEYKMLENYQGNHTKILIKHNVCGHEYKVAPSKFKYSNRRCPKCNKGVKMTIEDFSQRVKNIHGDEYDILTDYKNSNAKIKIQHKKCGNIFETTPSNFIKKTRPTRCPLCASSHGEKEVRGILAELNIEFEEQKSFDKMELKGKLRADFYLPDFNAVIEYCGKQHYEVVEHFGGVDGFKKTLARDKSKKEFCVNNKIAFIEIPYFTKDIKKEILSQLGMTNSLIS